MLLCALRVSAGALAVDIPAPLAPAWERLVAAHPLPPGTSLLPAAAEGAPAGRLIVRLDAREPGLVIDRVALSPVTVLSDPRTNARLADVKSGAFRVLPFESVRLPDRALPVDGRFPDAPEYPLWGDVSVSFETGDVALRRWFSSLPKGPVGPRRVSVLWIGAVGDVMPARGVDAALTAGGGLESVFGDTLPVLRSNTILVGNLEAAATVGGSRFRKTYTFRFAPSALGALERAGFSYFSLANNHTFDFGRQGFLDTLAALSARGIATSGAGSDAARAALPSVIWSGETEVRLLSFGAYPVDNSGFDGRRIARAGAATPGILWLDDEGLAAARRAFIPGSFSIAMVHGGREWRSTPTAEQQRLYRALIDAGADLVIGSHPHVLQGMEARGGGLIAYSLGNFLFPGMDGTPGGQDSVILRVGVSGGGIRCVQPVAVRLRGGTVRRAATDAALRSLAGLSRDGG
jgi:poly-gamma-glutamate synthesis protein (capsule biosynthesis protein)